MEEKMDWLTLGPILDGLNEFSVFDAACYWLEKKPSEALHDDSDVHRVIELIEKHTNGKYLRYRSARRSLGGDLVDVMAKPVSRNELVSMANSMGQKPFFLFPEVRGEQNQQPKQPTHKNSSDALYRIIAGLVILLCDKPRIQRYFTTKNGIKVVNRLTLHQDIRTALENLGADTGGTGKSQFYEVLPQELADEIINSLNIK